MAPRRGRLSFDLHRTIRGGVPWGFAGLFGASSEGRPGEASLSVVDHRPTDTAAGKVKGW